MPEISNPSPDDWIRIQGGEPKVVETDGIINIIHDYPEGSGMVVPTSPFHYQSFGTVDYSIDGRRVRFEVAKLRKFHGQPCETRSISVGGKTYNRKR